MAHTCCAFRACQVLTGTNEIPSFTTVPPSKKSGATVQYGPYENTQPFTLQPISGAQPATPLLNFTDIILWWKAPLFSEAVEQQP